MYPQNCPTDLLQTILRTGCTVKVILQTSWMNSETKNIWLHNFTKKSVMQTIWKWQKMIEFCISPITITSMLAVIHTNILLCYCKTCLWYTKVIQNLRVFFQSHLELSNRKLKGIMRWYKNAINQSNRKHQNNRISKGSDETNLS